MAEPNFKEVTGLAVDSSGFVFPGQPPGSPLQVDNNKLWVRAGSQKISVPELWKSLAPDRGVHVLHEGALLANMRTFQELFSSAFRQKTTVAWAVKSFAVPGAAVALAPTGCGADVGSLQELRIALEAGIDARKIVCTGVAKDLAEIEEIVACGATSIIDTLDEAEELNAAAGRAGKRARIGLRINPEIDVPTHDMVATGAIGSKFGIPVSQGLAFVDRLARYSLLDLDLVHMHLGSHFYQIDPASFADAINREGEFVQRLRKVAGISRIDIGGGFRFPYLSPKQAQQMEMTGDRFHLVTQQDVLAQSIRTLANRVSAIDADLEIVTEPGTAIVAGPCFTLGKVLGIREVSVITSRIDGKKVPAGWILGTPSTAEFLLKTAVTDLLFQTCIADKAEEDGFAAGLGGPLCFAGDIVSPMKTFLRMARPQRNDILALANTGAYIGCGFNFHNLPRFPIAILDLQGNLRVCRKAEPVNPMGHLDGHWESV